MSGLRFVVLMVFLLLTAAVLAIDPMVEKVVMINDRPMISLRDFAEIFDATVDYNVERNEISVSLYDTTVYLVPYQMTAWVNDQKVWLDMPAVILDDVTYLPVRFVCDAFRLPYDWTPVNQQVVIVNRWTTERVVFVLDIDWCRRTHVWRHEVDFRWYINFHHYTDGRRHEGYRPPNDRPDYRDDHDPKPGAPPHYNGNGPSDNDHRPPFDGNDRPPIKPPQHQGPGPSDGGHDQPGNTDRPGGSWTPNDRPGNTDRPGGSWTPNDRPGNTDRPGGSWTPNDRPGNTDRPGGSWTPNDRPGNTDRPGGSWTPNDRPGNRPWPVNGDRQYNGPGPQIDRPNGSNNGPIWQRNRPNDTMRPAGSPPRLDWLLKDAIIRPGGGPAPQANGTRPGGPDRAQAAPRHDGQSEKDSKAESSDKDSGDKDSGDKDSSDKDNSDNGGHGGRHGKG